MSMTYYGLIILTLAGILAASLSRDLGRAMRWFFRTLAHMVLILSIIAVAVFALLGRFPV